MQTRRMGILAAFAGVAVMIGVWVVMSGEPAAAPRGPTALKRAKAIPVDVNRIEIRGEEVFKRQQLMAKARPVRSAHPNQQTDPRNIGAIRPPAVLSSQKLPEGVYRLDEGGLGAAVEARRGELQRCYETAKFHEPDLGNQMTMVIELQPDEGVPLASVASVGVDGMSGGDMFGDCAASAFEKARFDASEPTTVRYPVTFQSPPE